jgi:pyrroline-5-carboxylate reductase
MQQRIAFIGGGNMASAIIGGLIKQGWPASHIEVVEPFNEARAKLQSEYGIAAKAHAGEFLARADLVVWAVKPQTFKDAAAQAQAHTGNALHLSVAAGIRSDTIAQWLGSERVVRSMPNTPALIGKGITALFARASVTDADKALVNQVLGSTGDVMWVGAEAQIDAVTALSGSGPAYVFYFLEAMREAGIGMGLDAAQAYQLAVATFIGAGELAKASIEPPEVLRQRVTSKGGTTYAALSAMEAGGIKAAFIAAMQAAQARAREMGEEFGAS